MIHKTHVDGGLAGEVREPRLEEAAADGINIAHEVAEAHVDVSIVRIGPGLGGMVQEEDELRLPLPKPPADPAQGRWQGRRPRETMVAEGHEVVIFELAVLAGYLLRGLRNLCLVVAAVVGDADEVGPWQWTDPALLDDILHEAEPATEKVRKEPPTRRRSLGKGDHLSSRFGVEASTKSYRCGYVLYLPTYPFA